MDLSLALPIFLITLREGVEATLVVGIVLAILAKAGQPHLRSWVYGGIGMGLLISLGLGVIFTQILSGLGQSHRPVSAVLKPALEAGFCLAAIALLSWMLLWMTQQAKALQGEVAAAVQSALQSSQAGVRVFSLITTAVLREGFETVLFLATQVQQGWMPLLLGATTGLLGATLIGVLLFWWGLKVNLRRFFQFMGILLLLIVAGLVMTLGKQLDVALIAYSQLQPQLHLCSPLTSDPAVSCILGPLLWDGRTILPDQQFPGVVFKALLGYRDRLFLVQILAYISFLVGVGGTYWRQLTPTAKPSQEAS